MANLYVELITRQQKESNELPIDFAFDNKQFNKMMEKWGLDPDKDVDKIYSLSCGGYIQKKDKDLLLDTRRRHNKELTAAIENDKTGDTFIYDMFLYELSNHEYGYTGDYTDTLDSLGFTLSEMSSPLKNGLQKAAKKIMERAA